MHKFFYLKYILILSLMGAEVFYLSHVISKYVSESNYISFSLDFAIRIIIVSLLFFLTFSLSIGSWSSFKWICVTSLFISIILFFSFNGYSLLYRASFALFSLLINLYTGFKAFHVKNNLIKTDLKVVTEINLLGYGFIFCCMGMLYVFFNRGQITNMNIGKILAPVMEKSVGDIINQQINSQISQQLAQTSNPDLNLNIELVNNVIKNQKEQLDITQVLENQINLFLNPYKDLFVPITAIIVFAIFQLYFWVSMVIFDLVSKPFFWIILKTGILKPDYKRVIQESVTL